MYQYALKENIFYRNVIFYKKMTKKSAKNLEKKCKPLIFAEQNSYYPI